jgi:hypothetical protein
MSKTVSIAYKNFMSAAPWVGGPSTRREWSNFRAPGGIYELGRAFNGLR